MGLGRRLAQRNGVYTPRRKAVGRPELATIKSVRRLFFSAGWQNKRDGWQAVLRERLLRVAYGEHAARFSVY